MHGTYEEKLGMRSRAKYLLLWAICLQFLPAAGYGGYLYFTHSAPEGNDTAGMFLASLIIACNFAALVFWCFGLAKYAESKGLSRAYGVLGVFGILGLALVGFKSDQFKIHIPIPADLTNYRRPTYDWTNKDLVH
jgi:hypothetical protein